ncbi:MAG: hypothetical protein QM522_11035 [Chitinophagaceae bacterium]|nr:hypothetical protein [Chitinophagaceae bacterium]
MVMWLEMKPDRYHRCGNDASFNDGFIWKAASMGDKGPGATIAGFLSVGDWVPGLSINASVRPAKPANAVPFPPAVIPLPDGWEPAWEPEVEPAAPRPLRPAPPQTLPLPPVIPDREPVIAPPIPGAVPGTKPAPIPGPLPLPKPTPGGNPLLPDGSVQKPKPLPPQTTPADQIIPWPGAPPVGSPGQSPRPDLIGIAGELGKIERKLEVMNRQPELGAGPLDPRDLSGLARFIWDLLSGMLDAGEYSLWSPCVPSGEPGSAADPMRYPWSASFGPIGGLEKRLDTIAEMLQGQKLLPQPTCRPPKVEGEWVTVNFQSLVAVNDRGRRLSKIFRYLDQTAAPLEDHVDHWRDFTWNAGPWCVIHKGLRWGVPQVWAATPEEGKRVIGHAAAIAGTDLSDPLGSWIVTRSSDLRYGREAEMRVARGRDLVWMVSKRSDPSGPAEYLRPLLPGEMTKLR